VQTHDRQIIHSSEEACWRTPPEAFIRLHEEFGFYIDLAANAEDHLLPWWLGPGSEFAEDALATDWAERFKQLTGNDRLRWNGFLNMPYSKTLANAYNTGRIKVDGQWVEHEKNPQKAKAYQVENWVEKCWQESQKGVSLTVVVPFAPQTDWYRTYVMGHGQGEIVDGRYPIVWNGHAAMEERRLPHRISFLRPDGSPAGNAGVNSVIVVWKPNPGYVGPWQPATRYWSYR
jgi:hypothetical protein